jgi:hypothetical protein
MAGITAWLVARVLGGLKAEVFSGLGEEIVGRLDINRFLHLLCAKSGGWARKGEGAGERSGKRK